jgi:hypothetical protein
MESESIFLRKRELFDFIQKGFFGKEIVDKLLPDGKPHEYEKELWDYKEELPVLPVNVKPNKNILEDFNFKISEIIKDVVSFYNSFGGYLLIGVSDKPRKVLGFDKAFDCDELNKRVKAATKHNIDCHYAKYIIHKGSKKYSIGLIYIPRRPDEKQPAQFHKNSHTSRTGKMAFREGDIYSREGSECKPAKKVEDFTFLFSKGHRRINYPDIYAEDPIIDNNLEARDPGFIKFIGREEYLVKLWRWLFDKHTPVKLLTGLGGVGKTTIAREFAEELRLKAPLPFDRIVWLSAKKQFFIAIEEDYISTTRVDFTDLNTLLAKILEELAWPREKIDPDWTREELIENVINTLIELPVFLIIDDIDSLEIGDQRDVFQILCFICGQTIGKAKVASRALLTARLDLGSANHQYFIVKGLDIDEFAEYVKMIAEKNELGIHLAPKSKLMKKFHRITDGSPTFASSIFRFLLYGENLNSVIEKWQGSDGEEVRKFAFKKELENLTDSQIRTLFTACLLGETSFIELRQITASSETLLRDDISALKQYHLISLGSELRKGGPRLVVPDSIRLMSSLMRSKIIDPIRLEKECAKLSVNSPKLEDNIGMVIKRVIALWRAKEYQEALDMARWGNSKFKDNPNLKCLLGRAYMTIQPPNPKQADKLFRRAYELKCGRPELIKLWINAKIELQDWIGLIEVAKLAEETFSDPKYTYLRLSAHGKVAESARESRDMESAAEYFFRGGKEINYLLKKNEYLSIKDDLSGLREMYFEKFVQIKDEMTTNPRDHLDTWLAINSVFKTNYYSVGLFLFGIRRLESWWNNVVNSYYYSQKVKNLMELQMNRFSGWIERFSNKELFSKGELSFIEERKNFLTKSFLEYNPSTL